MSQRFIAHYNLYTASFPDYPLSYEQFGEMLNIGGNTVLEEVKNGVLIGFAVVCGNSITMLAVEKGHTRQGVGSVLLAKCEEHIKGTGTKSITLCNGADSIFQGVPLESECAREFFEKRGYFSELVTVNMELDIRKFDYSSLDIYNPENVSYRFMNDDEKDKLIAAVEKTVPDWVKYYEENDEDKILIAECDGEIVAFEMINEYGGIFTKGSIKHGCIGCVGTVPEYRRRGIGLRMTAIGAEYLQKAGCDSVQLLYVERTSWYGRLGFYISSRQWMGKKQI